MTWRHMPRTSRPCARCATADPRGRPRAPRSQSSKGERDWLRTWLGASVSRQYVAALIDPRGNVFERLEWLGDSVLDVVVVDHRYRTKLNGCCRNKRQSDLCSDRVLATQMLQRDLAQHLDRDPSVGRHADWVEAAIGASWLTGGWPPAVETCRRLVHNPLRLPQNGPVPLSDSSLPRLAEVGSYLVEMGVTWHLWKTMPSSGPGLLSARRANLMSAASLVGTSRRPATRVQLGRVSRVER